MCFRVEQEGEDIGALVRAIENLFGDMVLQEGLRTSPNIALTDQAIVVVRHKDLNLRNMTFGLVPSWKEKANSALGNAKGETIDQLPSFKEQFATQRCLIPVTGFYEWRMDPGEKRKTPYKVMTDDEVFCLAGLWDHWPPKQLVSFAIITTEPNELIAQLHNRMPVVLKREHYQDWLDPENHDVAALKTMLKPYPAEHMAYQAYDRHVSGPGNKEKGLIFPVGDPIRLS